MLVLLLTIFNNSQVYGESSTILKIVPPPIEVRKYQDLTVSIDICDVIEMHAFQFKISWDTEFLDYVSHTIYPPWPPPIITEPPIIGEGYILISGACLPSIPFTGSASLATITFHAKESGTTNIFISDVVIQPDQPIMCEHAVITILPSYTWVSVAGVISSYGSDPAYGWMSVFAIVEEWADGWCTFMVPPLGGYKILIYPPLPFDFTLYAAWILNATAVKLNYNASDLWISGFWAVSNVTNPTSIIDIVKLTRNMTIAAGELRISNNWTSFTINMEGFESIYGNITDHCIREIDDPHKRLPRYDINHDYKIDMKDIFICCRAFGSTLGFSRYELYADTNFDLRIDMKDIFSCCLNFGKKY